MRSCLSTVSTLCVCVRAWSTCTTLLSSPLDKRIQFFAANILLSKVRREWSSLGSSNQSSMLAALMKPLQQSLAAHGSGGAPLDSVVVNQLCLVIGSASSLSGADAITGLLNHAFAVAAAGTPAAVSMALSLLSVRRLLHHVAVFLFRRLT
mgnify:CR=1 FL=1